MDEPTDQETIDWIATGTFLDALNESIKKLSEAVDRNTAVAASLDARIVALEVKEIARAFEEKRLEAERASEHAKLEELRTRTLGHTIVYASTHIGDWLYKQRDNKLVWLLIGALVVWLVPSMKDILAGIVGAVSTKR